MMTGNHKMIQNVAQKINEEIKELENWNSERRRYLEKIHQNLAFCFHMLVCLLIRSFLLAQCIFCLYYLCYSTKNFYWLFEMLFLVVIVIDTIWVVAKRHGFEWKWFLVSTFAYTFVILTTIWQLVIKKMDYNDYDCHMNMSEVFHENNWSFVIL